MSVSRGQVAGSMRKTIESLREANAGLVKANQEWQDRCLAMQTERDALRQRVEELIRMENIMSSELREKTLRVEELQRELGPCLPECIPPGVHSLHCTHAYLARAQSAEAERDALRAGSDEDDMRESDVDDMRA